MFFVVRVVRHVPIKKKLSLREMRGQTFAVRSVSSVFVHPRKVMGARFTKVNSGKEAVLYKDKKTKHIFKFWRQDWILSTYKMYLNGTPVHRRAAIRAARRFDLRDHQIFQTTESKEIPHHGIPLNQFAQITFVLSGMTEDVLSRAKKLGIPCPSYAKMVHHPTKEMFVVELSDLSKPGCIIVSANEITSLEIKKGIKNFDEIIEGIESDKKLLASIGLKSDESQHPPLSGWLVRINKKTGVAKRFLWDVTNLSYA